MREIVLDTETTGLSPREGHRVVEIGCVEIVNRFPTGQVFHRYLNPDRDMPAEAFAVHGISAEFLRDKPRFGDIVADFLAFIGDDPLIAHNAGFDFNFLNAELQRAAASMIRPERIVDTLQLARRKNPGGRHDLDTLCSRYGIDRSRRTRHGALLDAELLAEVYAELTGGKQAGLQLARGLPGSQSGEQIPAPRRPVPLVLVPTAEEREAHAAFVATLGDRPIWTDYAPD